MSDQPRTERRTPRSRPLTAAMVAIVPMVAGGCYTGFSAGLGGGRTNGDHGLRFTGAVATGGAYDIGPARVGVGFVPLGPGFSYGAEARAEICLRSTSPERTFTGQSLPNCVADLRRDTLNIRVAWLPNSWNEYVADDEKDPALTGYESGFSLNVGVGRDGRTRDPSDVVRTIQYANYGAGLFYTQRFFQGRKSDWIAGAYVEFSLRVDYLAAIANAVTRGPH